jgi:hypothetical protein
MNDIRWPSPFGYTVFCDDIRQEVLGKITLVGVYQGEMTVIGVAPVQIPKLALSIHFFEKPTEGHDPLEIQIFLPGDADEAPSQRVSIPPRDHVSAPEQQGAEDIRARIAVAFQFVPLVVHQEGTLKVRMKRGDDLFRLGALPIKLLTVEQAVAAGLVPGPPPN